ncbi:MAG: helix-turn-helix transcriptional regulator, partial [Myxococcota bacterium]
IHQWTDVKKASIYHALKSLRRSEHVEIVETLQNGNYPEKTLYTVTDKGREAFDDMQREAALGLFPKFYGFKLALKFNRRRTEEELHELAQAAVARIDTIKGKMNAYLSTLAEDSPQYAFDALFLEHDHHLYDQERAWILDAVERYNAMRRNA